jgi:O-antigen/teichoic acid export membrane protein
MAVLGALLNAGVVLSLSHGRSNPVYWVFVFVTGLSFLNVDWYFYAKGQVSLLFWRSFTVRALAIVAIVVTVKAPGDLMLYCLIFAASTVAANLTGFVFSIRQEKPFLSWRLREELKKARFFFANATLGSVSLYADQFLLGLVGTTTDVAYLSICRQMLSATVNFPVAACRSLLSQSTSVVGSPGHKRHIESLLVKYGVGVAVAGLLLALFGSFAVSLLAGSKYSIPMSVFFICGAAFVVTAANVFVDTQLSVAMKIERITTAGYATTAVVLLISLAVLLPVYRYTGALVSVVIGEAAGLLVVTVAHVKRGFFYATRTVSTSSRDL